jgi:hypothetical protein
MVTRLLAEKCGRCGSLLFPPHLATGMVVPATADFVCPNCGRAYEWTGKPPRLSVVSPTVSRDEDDDGDDQAGLCGLSVRAPVPFDPQRLRSVARKPHLWLVPTPEDTSAAKP